MVEWAIKKLSEVVGLRRGFDLPTRKREPGPYPVLSAGGTAGWHKEAGVRGPGFVVGRATNLGVPTWCSGDFWPLNTTLYADDFKGNDPKFLYHLFETLDLAGYDSGSVQPMLNRNYIAQIEVRIPPFPEQRAIAEVLGALDDKIAANNRVHRQSKELLAARFERLRIDVEPEPEESSTGIDELVELNPRLDAPTDSEPVYLEMKNLPDQDMTVRSWDRREARGGVRFTNGDTLLARITPCLENGKTGYVDFMRDGEVGLGSTEYIVMRSRQGVPPMLSYFLATSPRFREFAIKHLVGTSGRQRLAARDLAGLRVQRPDRYDLELFGALAGNLHAVVKADMESSRRLAATRDELLPLLMSGKVRVKDAEKVVEDVV